MSDVRLSVYVRFPAQSGWCSAIVPVSPWTKAHPLCLCIISSGLSFAKMEQARHMAMVSRLRINSLIHLALRACRHPLQTLQDAYNPDHPAAKERAAWRNYRRGGIPQVLREEQIMLVYNHSIICSLPFLYLTIESNVDVHNHICGTNRTLLTHLISQSKLSQEELNQLQKDTHFDKKELQQWYKG